jgi:hypothetical protein
VSWVFGAIVVVVVAGCVLFLVGGNGTGRWF